MLVVSFQILLGPGDFPNQLFPLPGPAFLPLKNGLGLLKQRTVFPQLLFRALRVLLGLGRAPGLPQALAQKAAALPNRL